MTSEMNVLIAVITIVVAMVVVIVITIMMFGWDDFKSCIMLIIILITIGTVWYGVTFFGYYVVGFFLHDEGFGVISTWIASFFILKFLLSIGDSIKSFLKPISNIFSRLELIINSFSKPTSIMCPNCHKYSGVINSPGSRAYGGGGTWWVDIKPSYKCLRCKHQWGGETSPVQY